MTLSEAKAIVNDQRYIDAVLFYRRKPMETSDETFRMAQSWIDSINFLTNTNLI